MAVIILFLLAAFIVAELWRVGTWPACTAAVVAALLAAKFFSLVL